MCALRQASVPFKGWALIPERGRGEGYDICAVLDAYSAVVDGAGALASPRPGVSGLGVSGGSVGDAAALGLSDMSGVFDRSAAVARTRVSYFQPSRVLARTGRAEDVP